mmetsp:Transcript_23381/g.55757  ORF Transcript_23381/g.55757 Transcript_23381/m.55757 type:complete len:554 (-) Transcript_23381:342-2003(-)
MHVPLLWSEATRHLLRAPAAEPSDIGEVDVVEHDDRGGDDADKEVVDHEHQRREAGEAVDRHHRSRRRCHERHHCRQRGVEAGDDCAVDCERQAAEDGPDSTVATALVPAVRGHEDRVRADAERQVDGEDVDGGVVLDLEDVVVEEEAHGQRHDDLKHREHRHERGPCVEPDVAADDDDGEDGEVEVAVDHARELLLLQRQRPKPHRHGGLVVVLLLGLRACIRRLKGPLVAARRRKALELVPLEEQRLDPLHRGPVRNACARAEAPDALADDILVARVLPAPALGVREHHLVEVELLAGAVVFVEEAVERRPEVDLGARRVDGRPDTRVDGRVVRLWLCVPLGRQRCRSGRHCCLVEERAGGELLLGVEVARDRVALLCARAGVVDDAQERVEGVRGHQRLNLAHVLDLLRREDVRVHVRVLVVVPEEHVQVRAVARLLARLFAFSGVLARRPRLERFQTIRPCESNGVLALARLPEAELPIMLRLLAHLHLARASIWDTLFCWRQRVHEAHQNEHDHNPAQVHPVVVVVNQSCESSRNPLRFIPVGVGIVG